MTQGTQAEFHDVSGGMLYGLEPRRIPNNSFKTLVNTEYNELRRLVKSKGYSLLQISPTGRVRDVNRIFDSSENLLGYLLGEDLIRFVDDIDDPAPAVDESHARCRSLLKKDQRDWWFYISDDGTGSNRSLRKWRYNSPATEDYTAGIPTQDTRPNIGILTGTALGTQYPFYTNVRDLVNDDDSIIISLLSSFWGVKITFGYDHPLLRSGLTANYIVIPIKSNTLTVSRNFDVSLFKWKKDGTGETKLDTTIALDGASTRIDINLGATLDFGDPDVQWHLQITNAGYSVNEQLVLYRSYPYFIDSRNDADKGGIQVSGYVPSSAGNFSDREPLMGLRVINSLTQDDRYHNWIVKDDGGLKGNYDPDLFRITSGAYDPAEYVWCQYLYSGAGSGNGVKDFIDAMDEENTIDAVILGMTQAGGGSFYELIEISRTHLDKYCAYSATSGFASWGIDPVHGGAVNINPVSGPVFVFTGGPSAILMENNQTRPENLNPLMDVLVEFRRRLWLLARIENTSGVVNTFIRYSEVDVYDYWDPLNEVAIPDTIIELKPLREDLMLAFSKNKTYRITPSGTGFDWIKIADVGIGGTGMSAATMEVIFWVNSLGAYKFDSAQVERLPNSIPNLLLINALIEDGAVMNVLSRVHQIWLSGDAIIGVTSNPCSLVYDYITDAFMIRETPKRIYLLKEAEDLLDTPVYLGFSGYVGNRSEDWADEGTAIVSVIKTKRFSAREGSDLSMMYFALIHSLVTSGSFSLTFVNSAGTEVTKTLSMVGTPTGDIFTKRVESYISGIWIDLTKTHNVNSDFEISGYMIGALPLIDGFLQEVTESEALARLFQGGKS